MKTISCENISFGYRQSQGENSVRVFSNLDFVVEKGEFVAILGHNGSGKSTLAKQFNAILLPSGGKVYTMGRDTSDETQLLEIRSRLGMVFQNPDNQIVATIVEEDVAFALENLGVEPAEIRRRVDDALKTVDMYDFKEHAPHQLSGGQKQRVAIAGVLAMNPDCIVLDEPTAMLDPRGRKEVIETLISLNKNGITIVLITHYMNEAARANRVVVMDNGKIIGDSTPLNIFRETDKMKKVGLDVPQSSELLAELKLAGISINKTAINSIDATNIIDDILKKAGVKAKK